MRIFAPTKGKRARENSPKRAWRAFPGNDATNNKNNILMHELKEYIDQRLTQLRDELLLQSKRVLNIDEAAKYIGCNKQHVYKLVHDGGIPFSKQGKKLWFDRLALDDWRLQNSCPVQLTNAQMQQKAADDILFR